MDFSQNRAKERIPIHKAKGVTPSEIYLNSLCEHTFLSLWSYPCIYRDQKINGKGDGKELCDMLVIFDEHILIFSDKQCSFPSTGDLDLDWKRWYRKTIERSANQAWGAERWLKSFPNRVFLDRACTIPFPLEIPTKDNTKFHLIIISHGGEDMCRRILGGSGSLMLSTSEFDQIDSLNKFPPPFTVSDLDTKKTFIHVLTESTLDILLKTLDTISDFVSYLEKKEKFLRSRTSVFSAGEEDLLAFYLKDINDEGDHDFIVDDEINAIALDEGLWKEFCKSPQRLEQIKQNAISYSWDYLIEEFSYHAMTATQYFTNHLELSETEIGLRFMARESRTRRRMLMKGAIEVFTNAPEGSYHLRCCQPSSEGDPYYFFFCLPKPSYASYEQYREVRMSYLEAGLMIVKLKFPDAIDIIGIASEPVNADFQSSEDLLYLDARIWTEEMNEEAKTLQKETRILTSSTRFDMNEKEYPDIN